MKPPALLQLYRKAALNRDDAFVFLVAFHAHAHALDDDVDEPGRHRINAVDRCVEVAVLTNCDFWRANHLALAPIHAVVASLYHTSVIAPGPLTDTLRLSGNLMVLAVAFLCGGWVHMQAVAAELWPLVLRDQTPTVPTP
jgi:hypothetical protein